MAKVSTLMCSLTLSASTLLAQVAAPGPTAAGLIRLNVTALGSGSEPVTDLKREDFQISDQGKPQRIVFFRNRASAPAPDASTPQEHSNVTAGASMHSTVILFDLLNVTSSDRLDIWHKVGRSLQQLESGDSLYFYLLSLEGNLTPIHAIGNKAGDDHTWTQTVEKNLDQAMKAASHARPAQMADQELVVKKTYVALETLGNQLTALPGRRDIIWITSSMPNVWNNKLPCNGDWVDCALYVPHLSVTLGVDKVAVNPLSYTGNASPEMTRDIEQMALLTGGSMYVAEDIGTVLKQVAKNAAASYSIYYEAPPENFDGKFHKIKTTVERKGLKVVAKQRYFAYPDKTPENTKQHALLAGAYQSPIDDPSIGLSGSVTPGETAKTAHLQIRVNPSDLLLRDEGGRLADNLTVLVSDIGAAGPIGEPTLSNINVNIPREERDKAMKEGIPIANDHAIPDTAQKIRLIVLDQNSDSVGSLTLPIGR